MLYLTSICPFVVQVPLMLELSIEVQVEGIFPLVPNAIEELVSHITDDTMAVIRVLYYLYQCNIFTTTFVD